MPDLVFRVKMIGGQPVVQEMQSLDQAYKAVGTSGTQAMHEGEKAASTFGGALHGVKEMAAGLAVAFGGMQIAEQISHWTEKVIEFEESFARVTTLFEGSAAQYKELEKRLLNIGAEAGSASELAKTLYDVIQSGVSTVDSIAYVESAMKLAKTAFIDTASAVDLLKIAQNAYGKSTDQVGRSAETLFRILRTGGGIGAEELTKGLSRLAMTAAGLKVPLEDVGAALSTLKRFQIPAAQGAVILTTLFTKMSTEGSKLNKNLANLGVEVNASTFKNGGLARVLAKLGEVIQGDTELAQELGLQGKQMNAFLALAGQGAEVFTDQLVKMNEEGEHMIDAHERMEDTVSERWEKMINTVERSVLKNTKLIDDLKVAIVGLGNAIVFLTDNFQGLMLAFGGFLAMQKGASIVTAIATGTTTLAASITALIPLLASLGVAAAIFIVWKTYKDNVQALNDELERSGYVSKEAQENMKIYEEELKAMGVEISRGPNESLKAYMDRLTELKNLQSLKGKISFEGIPEIQIAAAEEGLKRVKGFTEEERKLLEEIQKKMKEGGAPAEDLAKKFELIQRAGKSADLFIKAYSEDIIKAAEASKIFGTELPPSIAGILDQAKAYEKAKEAAKDSIEVQKKYEEAVKEGDATMKKSVATLKENNLEGYAPLLERIREYTRDHLLAIGAVKDKSAAEVEANRTVEKLTDTLIKNKQELKNVANAERYTMEASIALKEEFRRLGLAVPIGSLGQLEDRLQQVKKDMEVLGIRNVAIEIEDAQKAYEDLMSDNTVPQWMKDDAFLAMLRKRAEGSEALSDQYYADLVKMAQSTDTVLRGKALPIWIEFAEKSKDISGKLSGPYEQDLIKIMSGTDKALKEKLLPMWEDYIKSCRDINGNLPPELDKLNNKIIKDAERASGKMEEVWQNQISTIFTDFSKGCADIIFEGKSMTETLKGIFKEFGKMVVRTFIEEMFNPVKELLRKMIHDIFKVFQGSGSTTGTGGGGGNIFSTIWGGIKNIFSGGGGGAASTSTAGLGGAEMGTGAMLMENAPGFGVLLPGAGAAATAGAAGAATATASSAKGLFGLPKGGIGGHGIGGAAGGLMTTAGVMLYMDSLKRKGVAGWAESIGGGAMAGLALGGPIGAAVGAAVGLVTRLIKLAIGKKADEAGAMEVARDFGGVSVSKDQFKSYFEGIGLTEPQAYPIRKDISSAPKFLAEIAGPAAMAQGKMDAFLKSLEAVGTEWGTFNFRQAYEIGQLTGDWTELDKAYKDAFEHSSKLKETMPDWEDKLLMQGSATKKVAADFENLYKTWMEGGEYSQEFVDFLEKNKEALDEAAKSSSLFAKQLDIARQAAEAFKELGPLIEGFKSIKEGLDQLSPSADTMFDKFLKTGEITDEFRAKIVELGGDPALFEAVAAAGQAANKFEILCQQFRDTGVASDELRSMIKDLGGDLTALDNAAGLPKLMEALGSLNDFQAGLNEILPDLNPLQEILDGIWNKDTWQRLQDMGFDPSKFVTITDLIKYEKGWDAAVDDFYNKTEKVWDETKQKYVDKWAGLKKGGLVEQALSKYGGAEGQLALKRYYEQGVNTISPALLDKVKGNIDDTFRTERESLMDYLKTAGEGIQTQIDTLMQGVEDSFATVADKLNKTFMDAKDAVNGNLVLILANLDKQLKQQTDIVALAQTVLNTPTTTPTTTPELPITEPDYPGDEYGYGGYRVPGAARGGLISREGLAYLHSGELVMPSTQTAIVQQVDSLRELIESVAKAAGTGHQLPRPPVTVNQNVVQFPGRMPRPRTNEEGTSSITRDEDGTGDVHFHFEGAVITVNDIEQLIADMWERRYNRGGFKMIRNRAR